MVKRTLCFFIAGLMFAVLFAVPAIAQDASPQAAPASAATNAPEVIIQQARHFLQVCGLPSPQGEAQTKIETIYAPAVVWNITWNGYDLDIEAATGHVINFQNYHRQDQRYHNVARTGERRFGSLEEASTEVWRLVRAIGIPDHAYLSAIAEHSDKELQAHDADPVDIGAGINWGFSDSLNYPLLGLHPGEGNESGISLMLDAEDGQLMFLSRNLRSIVESSNLQLTQPQALEIAQNAYRQWSTQDQSLIYPNNSSDMPTVELGYVNRGGLFDFVNGARPRRTDPIQWRLAWGIYFGEAAIFVDAGNGEILGGQLARGMPNSHPKIKTHFSPKSSLDKSTLQNLIQTASEIKVYPHASSSATEKYPRLVLSQVSDQGMFAVLRQTKYFQSNAPAFASSTLVMKTKAHNPVELRYDGEAGLLGAGNQWCFVPNKFKTWMQRKLASITVSPAKRPLK